MPGVSIGKAAPVKETRPTSPNMPRHDLPVFCVVWSQVEREHDFGGFQDNVLDVTVRRDDFMTTRRRSTDGARGMTPHR